MIIKKRAVTFAIVTFLILVALIYRLADIQLLHTESFSSSKVNLIEESVRQRTQVMVLDQGRGRFVDRNGAPLTHDYFPSLILFPFLKHMDWPMEELASILGVPSNDVRNTIEEIEEPVVFGIPKPLALTINQMEKINELKIPGVFAVYRQSKVEELVAEHLIGIIRQDKDQVIERYANKVEEGKLSVHTPIGIIGLQRVFDEFLLPEGESKLLYHVDNRGGPLFGIDVKYTAPANPYYPISIQTTLDKSIQETAEQIIEKSGMKKGGLVLLDIETNEILSMVSMPNLNHSNPFSTDGGGHNYMLESQIPGSVFKTVIAAAAIENNMIEPERQFDCDLDLYGDTDELHQLGKLNFESSFAQSCNYTFATLANELTEVKPESIELFAEKLGLIQPVGWKGNVFHFQELDQLPLNNSGQIWGDPNDKSVDKAISQTAIGQKEVRVTPLAVANMMATIARGGDKQQVKAVSKILYKNGSTLFSFNDQKIEGDSIAPYTAMKLQQLLQRVVTDEKGTGRRFQALETEVAGKSGTAETGRENELGQSLVNKWFTGYFPAKKPKYALVVVELDVPGSESMTNDIYYQMVDVMNK
ncbi:peptidoglycan D,D-transpeptidase FtsI family protein [Bacillus sp. DJP31]|uniref:peptidoglycan D,D-transpeptidase FtsI family protein n=1 Tax=Bacillus sp. DJP31 TaxID=3409789 RepID=UPI003BB7B38E